MRRPGPKARRGAVRHGAECFNFYFPQELDPEFLVVWSKEVAKDGTVLIDAGSRPVHYARPADICRAMLILVIIIG